jgi:hypothetical protein
MQQKESKTNWHFFTSITKSVCRILGCIWGMVYGDLYVMAAAFLGAEVLGILEEL